MRRFWKILRSDLGDEDVKTLMHMAYQDEFDISQRALYDNYNSTFHYLVLANQPNLLRHVLDNQFDLQILNSKNHAGQTALHMACILVANGCGLTESFKVLLEYRADPNFKDNRKNTCLHYLVKTGSKSIISDFISHSQVEVDITLRDERGKMAYQYS